MRPPIKTEVGIYIIAIVRINMTKVMRQLDRAGAWEVARNLLHILIENDIPTFRVDDHAIFVESPRVNLRAEVLISALVMIHLNSIIFLYKGFFVSLKSELRVNLCCWAIRHLTVGCGIRLRARLQSPSVPNPLRHGNSDYGSLTTTAQIDWRRVQRAQSKGSRHWAEKTIRERTPGAPTAGGAIAREMRGVARKQWDRQRNRERERSKGGREWAKGGRGGKERVHP